MVLVVLFPLEDEKNVDVKTIFTCSQTCSLEMKPLDSELQCEACGLNCLLTGCKSKPAG